MSTLHLLVAMAFVSVLLAMFFSLILVLAKTQVLPNPFFEIASVVVAGCATIAAVGVLSLIVRFLSRVAP
jgi:hypothetical protein